MTDSDLALAQQLLAFEWPSPAYLSGAVVFGLAGLAAWRHGRRQERRATQWIGAALMFFPYAVSTTWLLYAVGLALCAGVWFDLR